MNFFDHDLFHIIFIKIIWNYKFIIINIFFIFLKYIIYG